MKQNNPGVGSTTRTLPKSLGADEALRELSDADRGDTIQRRIESAAKRAGLSYWRAFDIWYRKARRIEDYELDAISAAIEKKRKEANRNELHELHTRLARLESLLAQADADFYRPQITALRDQRDGFGGKSDAADRALA